MEELDRVVEESLELLYGSPDDKEEGIHKILSLCQDPSILEDVIQNHQLMSALARLLGESESLPIELTFGIVKLFCIFSFIEDFHQVLSSHRIGSLALGLVELELKRAWHRGTEPALRTTDEVVPADFTFDLATRMYTFSSKQEQVLLVCLSILDKLADDFTVLRKMMNKSLVSILTRCLQQQSSESAMMSLSLLRKASVFEDTAVELSRAGCNAIPLLVNLCNCPRETHQDVLVTLFNLSFHQECATLISSLNIHSRLVALLQNPLLCNQTLQLMYHLSERDEDQKRLEAGIGPALIDLLTTSAANGELDRGFAGLLVNMSLHDLCSEELMRLGAIDHIFCIIRQSQDGTKQILLKVARNLSRQSWFLQARLSKALQVHDMAPLVGVVKDPLSYIHIAEGEEITDNGNTLRTSMYWEKHFWDAHVDFILKRALCCKKDDLLVEWLGIMNNLTRDDFPAGVQWHDLLDDHQSGIVKLFRKLLDPSCHDDVKLELIIWLGELCFSKECSDWIASNDLINIIHSVFIEQPQDAEMRLQILAFYDRCLLYEVTRFQVVGGDGVVAAILDCLSGESSLRFAAETCLILIEDFDRDEDGVPGEICLFIRHRRHKIIK